MKLRKPQRSATGGHTLLPAAHTSHPHVLVALGTLPVRTFLSWTFGRSTVVRSISPKPYCQSSTHRRCGEFGLQYCSTQPSLHVSSLLFVLYHSNLCCLQWLSRCRYSPPLDWEFLTFFSLYLVPTFYNADCKSLTVCKP